MAAPRATKASFTLTVNFGMVQIGVKAYSSLAERDLGRKMFVNGDHPVGYASVDKVTGEIILSSEVVKKFELPDGRLVELSDEEMQTAGQAQPGVNAEFMAVVPAGSMTALPYAYYEARPASPAMAKPFALLMYVLRHRHLLIQLRVINRGKESLAYLNGTGELLFAYWPQDEREEQLPAPSVPFSSEEISLALTLIDQLYSDSAGEASVPKAVLRDRVVAYATAKADATDKPAEASDSGEQVTDLMALLTASVEANKA